MGCQPVFVTAFDYFYLEWFNSPPVCFGFLQQSQQEIGVSKLTVGVTMSVNALYVSRLHPAARPMPAGIVSSDPAKDKQ